MPSNITLHDAIEVVLLAKKDNFALMKRLLILSFVLVLSSNLWAVSPAEPTSHAYARSDEHHFLEIFRSNYFVSGLPLDRKADALTSDIKFQVSVRTNLWRNMGGSGVNCFVGYTQTSLWNIFAPSSPFYDNTYNPGLYFERDLFREGRQIGSLLFGYEHKSNGRADALSRSVNYLFVSYTHLLPHNFALQGKAWMGQSYIEETSSLALYNRYLGYFNLTAMWASTSRRMNASVMIEPTGRFDDMNYTAEFCYRIGAKHNNPYLYIQLHRGYDEALRDCTPDIEPRTMLRFGLCIRPHTTNLY